MKSELLYFWGNKSRYRLYGSTKNTPTPISNKNPIANTFNNEIKLRSAF
ncbi:hypothetical protein CHRYSEO8AT_470005 [Chryseobacterium sp. 8AT]|nr:hypothetical protein CHRYSEO8AT_470005 [Chryseobacterium sp. 8AT]